jgi:outer membrane protein OmpA-like peptidoglycan-associated protein
MSSTKRARRRGSPCRQRRSFKTDTGRSLAVAAATLVAALGTTNSARAEAPAAGALDRFDPAPAGDAFFSLPSADVEGRLRVTAAAHVELAYEPLVLRAGTNPPLAWVKDQAFLHLQASIEVLKRLKLDLDVPALLAEGGTTGSLNDVQVTAPGGAHVGDLRIGLRTALLHQSGLVPAAGIGLSVWAPTGSASSFAGAGVARLQPSIVVGAEYTHLVWGASAGARFQPSDADAVVGSQVIGNAGVAARFVGLMLGPEVTYGVTLGDQRAALLSHVAGSNGELWLAARYRIDAPPGASNAVPRVVLGLAGGPGLGRGPGTPAFRVIAGLSASFDVISPDEPAAEVATSANAAKPRAAPSDGDLDEAPRAAPDRDRDGIPDADDACPDVPGVASDDPKKNGCPADADGDGIPDDKDACPNENGPPNADPKKNGCPTSVRVEGTQIVILQQVNFDTGKATIKQDSFDLLGQVAAVLEQHAEIARLAVDGHTDDRGGDGPNKVLSERRALAVVHWLVEHGVDARRLEARGFGQRRPVASNKTDAGRAQNRRVEFLIRRRTTLGKRGWQDGPVDDGNDAPADAKPGGAR